MIQCRRVKINFSQNFSSGLKRREIPGQGTLKHIFDQMVQRDRIPHAMLIHSNEGGSGLAMATWLAQMAMCEAPSQGDPCGDCSACHRTAKLAHPDLHFIFPVNGNKQVKKKEDRHSDSFLDAWREALTTNPYMSLIDWYQQIDIEKKQGFIGDEESSALRRKLALRSFEGGRRIFVIWHADRMNDSFANKLLKNLEEPSPRTLFILVSEKPSKLLSTIVSRVQIFREEHLEEQELADMLMAQHGVDEQGALEIAFRAEGNIAQAIRETRDANDPLLQEFKDWMRMAYKQDLVGLYFWSEKMARGTRDAQRQFCQSALKVLDRCYRMGWIQGNIPLSGEDAKFYKDFSPFINTANIQGFMDMLEKTAFHIERNVNEKLCWYDSSVQAIRLVHAGKKSFAA